MILKDELLFLVISFSYYFILFFYYIYILLINLVQLRFLIYNFSLKKLSKIDDICNTIEGKTETEMWQENGRKNLFSENLNSRRICLIFNRFKSLFWNFSFKLVPNKGVRVGK